MFLFYITQPLLWKLNNNFENCICYLFQGGFSSLSVGVAPTKATSHLHSRNKNLRQRPVDSKEGAGICLLQRVCPTQCELIKANDAPHTVRADQGQRHKLHLCCWKQSQFERSMNIYQERSQFHEVFVGLSTSLGLSGWDTVKM